MDQIQQQRPNLPSLLRGPPKTQTHHAGPGPSEHGIFYLFLWRTRREHREPFGTASDYRPTAPAALPALRRTTKGPQEPPPPPIPLRATLGAEVLTLAVVILASRVAAREDCRAGEF